MTDKEIASYEDFLADILKVWDCDEQTWVEGMPVILRFENEDVVIEKACDISSLRVATLVGDEEALLDFIQRKNGMLDSCLCWLRADIVGLEVGELIGIRYASVFI